MKKLLLLSIVGVFSLSSFANKSTVLKAASTWKYTCPNGTTGTFICPCSQADAQIIGNQKCK